MNGHFFKSPLLFVLLTSFLLRFFYFLIVAGVNPEGFWTYDSHIYWRLAENIVSHNSFSISRELPFYPEIFRIPGYPFFLSIIQIFGGNAETVIFLQTLMSTLTCLITYRISQTIGGTENQSLTAAFILSVDITSIVNNCLVMSDTLFTLLFVLSAYYFLKYHFIGNIRNLIACALFVGFSIYLRPVGFFIPLLFCLFIIFKKKQNLISGAKRVLLFLSVILILVAPWYVRNYQHFGIIGFSTSGQLNLYKCHAVNIYSQKHNLNFEEARLKLNGEMIKKFKVKWPDEAVKYAQMIGDEALKIILENPWLFIKQQCVGALEILFKPTRGELDKQLGLAPDFNPITGFKHHDEGLLRRYIKLTSRVTIVVSIMEMSFICAIFAGILYSLKLMYKEKKIMLILFFCAFVLYFANMTVPPANYARFRVPAMPFIALLGAVGWAQWWGIIRLKYARLFG